ncbi:alcohol dehydrogenase catalytic domain-containing protein [Pseudonocardia sp. KRD291]|uniref:alcohol dehydrogenase catalytic domain-containing protein n=1 Tax=Pseudonocardia sp. KRD291 TaxID=2792007 RepID=UPI001C4A0C58|nr:alcohol dehydrogenase catalytic domain-containing protein [Pseudonocardia sp. KRD291]MBW0100989.1 alcohol dehydrogenase catalytic domain-containing protein [Pseudonocardia sp. KRD291]
MKAIQLLGPTKLELTEVDTPVVGEHEVLLRVLAAGVCQTDVHMRRTTEAWIPAGTILGHETAGEIVEVGAGVRGWEAGTSAAVYPVWSCGTCSACTAGRQNACRRTGNRMFPAATPGVSVNGGMAEYMVVPAAALVGIADLDPAVAATLTDAALTPYHSVRETAHLLTPGSIAVVIGAGGLGRMAIQILRAITAARIVVLDVRDDALDAVRSEVDAALHSADPTVAEQVLSRTGGYGAEVVLDLVGTDSTLALATGIVAPYGAVRAIGLTEGHFTFETSQGAMSLPWGASLTRPYSGTKADLVEVVALAASGHLRPQVQTFPLDQGLLALDELEAGRLTGRGVLLPEQN